MRRVYIIIVMFAAALAVSAQATFSENKAKAERFFSHGEWASASAIYNFMLHERPSEPFTYGRAIVSTEMLSDTLRSMQLLSEAMSHGVPLDSVLSNVRSCSFAIGQGHLYERFMLDAARHNAWMSRPLDAYLLRYYAFRRNGQQMVAYANKMLVGAPDNLQFLDILAQGYMIEGLGSKAVDAWQRMLAVNNDNLTALLNLANYYDITGDRTNALFYFRRVQELEPTPYVAAAIERLQG